MAGNRIHCHKLVVAITTIKTQITSHVQIGDRGDVVATGHRNRDEIDTADDCRSRTSIDRRVHSSDGVVSTALRHLNFVGRVVTDHQKNRITDNHLNIASQHFARLKLVVVVPICFFSSFESHGADTWVFTKRTRAG